MRIKRVFSGIVSGGVASLLLFTSSAYAEITDIQQAINISGKQRMLTQKILGSYAMLGINFQPEKSKQRLHESINLFDQQLTDLMGFSVTPEVGQQLASVEKLWSPLKSQLTAAPDKAKAVNLWEKTDALLKSSHKAVTLITKASGTATGDIINTSGRQRMLSQRLNTLYMLRAWGVEGFDFAAKFKNGVDEFKVSQSKLEGSDLTTTEIKQKLASANKSFIWFERSASKQTDKYVPALVVRAADRILSDMNEATKLYASKK